MAAAKLADEARDARVVGDLDEAMLNVRRLLRRRNVLVAGGVGCVLHRDLAGLAVKRGGEEERLTILRAERNHAVDCWAEAHVEHPVGFVENQHLDVVETEGAAAEQILKPAGSCHNDVRLGCRAGLLLKADAAVDGCHLQRAGMGDWVALVNDLRCELARWREN